MQTTKSNLDALLASAKETNISANKGGNSREKIYRFQLANDVPTIEQKKKRNKLRRLTDAHCMNVISAFKRESKIGKETKEEIKKFTEFYKAEFILNDFSLNSICANNRSEADKKIIRLCLDICKENISFK